MNWKHYAGMIGATLIALLVINFIAGMLGFTAWIYNPYGKLTGSTTAATS